MFALSSVLGLVLLAVVGCIMWLQNLLDDL